MAFGHGNDVEIEKTKQVIEYVVEVPVYKDVIVDRPVWVDKIIQMPVFVPYEVPRATFVDKEVSVPVFKHVEVPVEKIVEVQKEVVVFKEREVTIERPQFRDRIVDVIKPHYTCQACGHSV